MTTHHCPSCGLTVTPWSPGCGQLHDAIGRHWHLDCYAAAHLLAEYEGRLLHEIGNNSDSSESGMLAYEVRGPITDLSLSGGRLHLRVDLYLPAEGEEWDPDRWEALAAHLYAPPTRASWRSIYWVARRLAAELEAHHGRGDEVWEWVDCGNLSRVRLPAHVEVYQGWPSLSQREAA